MVGTAMSEQVSLKDRLLRGEHEQGREVTCLWDPPFDISAVPNMTISVCLAKNPLLAYF